MIKINYVCRKCGNKFTAMIFEKGEAEEKKVSTGPVRCPRCGNDSVERN
jgi:DNA-directed RNA polymerase subunit RPC12/RpoP